MFCRQRWINWAASIFFLIAAASCDGLGAGCGCGTEPLPAGGLPPDQTVEGGAQIRVTQAGFEKFTSLIPAVINDTIGAGFCIPRDEVFDIGIAEATICSTQDGTCNPGCQVDMNVDFTNISAGGQDLNIQIQFDVGADVHIDYEVFFVITGQCTASASLNNGFVDMDVRFGIDPATGELTIEPVDINTLDLTGIGMSGCGGIADIVGDAINLFAQLLDSFLGDLILDVLQPQINDLFQGLLPDPLGIEGMVDMGALTGAVAPGTNALVEMRGVPGGFVQLSNGGMTLGVILGMNADEDVSTRTPDLDSEPALCVPPIPPPDFAAGPSPLPTSPRNTFILNAADEFSGSPEPDADIAIGLSETMLDLAGHHAVTSGGLCVGVGSELIPQLNLGLFGLLVPSFAELGSDDGKDPLLLVTRPIYGIDFAIGDGTEASPSLQINLREFEIDFYAFIFERYVRGFTLRLDMTVGVNLAFATTAEGNPAILPILTGLEADAIQVTALNSEFLRESDADIERTVPAVLDLALPLLSQGLEPIELPEFAGFTMTDLTTAKVVTAEDEFLAITATLGSSMMLQELAQRFPSVSQMLAAPEHIPPRATTQASLRKAISPAPKYVRAALAGDHKGQLPEVVIDVQPYDELGRKLEYTWNINGGMWRPFTDHSPLVIRDRALAFQGKYDIGVRARVAGDYRTLDLDTHIVPVVIDSVGPTIHTSRARVDDTHVFVPATDLVSPDSAIQYAYGHPGDDAPATDWGTSGLALTALPGLAAGSEVMVYARDEQGNETSTPVDMGPVVGFHGTGGEEGCGCAATGADTGELGGMALLIALAALLLVGRRQTVALARRVAGLSERSPAFRRVLTAVVYAGVTIAGSTLIPACNCGSDQICAADEDCSLVCENGFGFCINQACECPPTVPLGRVGEFSEMALAPGGNVWVSAYNSFYGDLNVAEWSSEGRIPDEAWQFVDGVPQDAPIVTKPDDLRGGRVLEGEDVGKYTSIAANSAGEVMVSYFDEDNLSLKFAYSKGTGEWTIHTVDEGLAGNDPELGYEIVGQYSSISLTEDGRPGIAYYAHVGEAGAARTEVRFASAQSPSPERAEDWLTFVVDQAEITIDPENPDPLSIPEGTGLFIDSARASDQTPIVVYYDRINGDLKVSRFDLVAGTFAPPEILDGADGSDVGWYPSVAVDSEDNLHVSYVSASSDDLRYINTIDNVPEIVDDGYRIVGTTEDGLPKPEFHFVGDDSSIVMTDIGPVIVYQDATSHELLLNRKNSSGFWEFIPLAGNELEFVGGYGFYASAGFNGSEVVISSWVVHPPLDEVWIEIFRESVVIE